MNAPQSKHRLPRLTDPEERRVPLRHRVRQSQPDHIAVKCDRTIEVGDRQMSFPQTLDWDDGHAVLLSVVVAWQVAPKPTA
jgi:hypothetical protein